MSKSNPGTGRECWVLWNINPAFPYMETAREKPSKKPGKGQEWRLMVEAPASPPAPGKSDKFIHGFAYALANLVRLHGDTTEARDLWRESGYKMKGFVAAGVDEYDLETLRRLEWLK